MILSLLYWLAPVWVVVGKVQLILSTVAVFIMLTTQLLKRHPNSFAVVSVVGLAFIVSCAILNTFNMNQTILALYGMFTIILILNPVGGYISRLASGHNVNHSHVNHAQHNKYSH
jgi:hypothetical protein